MKDNMFGLNRAIYSKQKFNKSQEINPTAITGLDIKLLPNNPVFIDSKELLEPLYVPKQDILEKGLTREIERMYYPDSFLNRLIYDSVEQSYFHEKFNVSGIKLDVLPYYIPKNTEDITLIFESRFESGNLRRAIHV